MNELQNLVQIFQNRLFRIPDYQRGYAWQDHQLMDFWEDLINLQPERNHYTGLLSIKLLNREESKQLDKNDQWLLSNNSYRAYHIVDGQQRLTTFVILLNEILDFTMALPEYANTPEAGVYINYESVRDIRAKFISRQMPPEGLVTTYLFGYENDNPSAEYLRHKIFGEKYGGTLKETYYTKNLKNAKEFFSRELKEYYEKKGTPGITEMYIKLTLHLMFNIHEIEDDYDVFIAFETMNNRGKRLTNLELLKNRLIYLTTLYNKNVLDERNEVALREKINDAWKEVYYQLGRNENEPLSDDEFLRAHWIIYFSYSRKKGDDYIKFLLRKFSHKFIFENAVQDVEQEEAEDEFEDNEEDIDDEMTLTPQEEDEMSEFLRPGEIADYVNSLKETAEYWYYTFFPEESKDLSEEEKLWIDRLNRIGINYFRPLIAVAINPSVGATEGERLELLAAVERFIYINFRMAMYQSSYKSSDYYRKTREVYIGKLSLSDVTEDLNETTDRKSENAVESFANKMNSRFDSNDGFYSWRDLKYFLFEYEYSLASKFKLHKLSWGVLTTVVKDKISIEHILPQTPTKLYWKNQFRQFYGNKKEMKWLAASLGNLLPLSQSINSSLQNDSFDDKKQRGYSNGSHSEIEVSKETEWNAEKIYERGMKLLHFMEERWNFHFSSEKQMENLLHIGFVKDGGPVPEEITEEKNDKIFSDIDTGETRHTQRKAYWSYALPILREAHGGNGPYKNVNPSTNDYLDGFFRIRGIHVYCAIKVQPFSVRTGLWIDTGDRASSKAMFDLLYSSKAEIEKNIDLPIEWKRKDDNRACSIDIVLDDVDYRDKEQWSKIANFHAKYSKALADVVVYPRVEQIRNVVK